jgi:hypothetical protein
VLASSSPQGEVLGSLVEREHAMAESEFDFNQSKQHFLEAARKEQRSLRSRILFWFLALMAATAVAVLIAVLVFSGRWTDYKSAAGKFSAQFPEPPQEKIMHDDKAVGWEWGERCFLIMYSDIPGATEAGLDVAAAAFAQDQGGKVTSVAKIKLGDYPGRDAKAQLLGGREIRTRMYIANNRMYNVTVSGPKGYTTSPDAEKFFASFKITQ